MQGEMIAVLGREFVPAVALQVTHELLEQHRCALDAMPVRVALSMEHALVFAFEELPS
jgi:hypothetical protein